MSRAARLLLTLCWIWPSWGRAADAPLAQAWQVFQRGQTEEATLQAQAMLPTLTRPQSLRDAHLLLGACAYLRGDQDQATEQLITALSYDPTYQPDPLLLAPDLQQLVKEVARDHQAEIKALAAALILPNLTEALPIKFYLSII